MERTMRRINNVGWCQGRTLSVPRLHDQYQYYVILTISLHPVNHQEKKGYEIFNEMNEDHSRECLFVGSKTFMV